MGDRHFPSADQAGQAVTLPALHNLPAQPTPFIGRNAELAQIETLLATPDCRLLTLLGPGGIGKTRLAIEAATRQADNFADGVCFVSLAPAETTEVVAVMLAQGLGLQYTILQSIVKPMPKYFTTFPDGYCWTPTISS